MHKSMQTYLIGSAVFQAKCQNGERMWSKWLWPWNGCWYQIVVSEILKPPWLPWVFMHNSLTQSLKRMVWKTKKHPVSSSSAGRNVSLIREVRREGPDWSKLTRRWQMQITTHYSSGMQKSISEHTMPKTSKWIGYSSRRLNKSTK